MSRVRLPERFSLLLVEDDEVDRMAFERYVRREKKPYDYVAVSSVSEARVAIEEGDFDVILSDFHLGDGTGADVLALDTGAPVVVITGAGDEATAIQAMRGGAFDYLIKDAERSYLPMLPVTVEAAWRRWSAERRAHMLSQALTSINDSIYITDRDGRLIFVNDTFRAAYGYDDDDVLGQATDMLWADLSRAGQLLPTKPGELPPGGERGECLQQRRDGSVFPGLLSRSTILDPQGHATAMVGAVRDITDRKRNEEALRESQERYALTAAGANDGLWDWDLRTGTVYYSPRWAHTLGYHEQEIGDTLDAWLELVHPEERSALERQLERHLAGGSGHFETEHRMRTKSGAWRWVQTRGLAVRDETGTVYRMAGSQRDITDRKEAEKKLSHQALHDDLTGLPNRALFMDRLEHAVRRASRKKEYNFGVIFLDLDRFKVINDSLGHMAGDQLLTSIARRLESCLRMGDTVARLGGDEFAILVEELEDQKQIDRVAERVQEELSEPFTIFGREVFTSASLGIALSSSDYERPADILRDADTAMYRAKALGRTRQVRFDPEMHTSAVAQLAMETDLRRALERDELTLRYLPTVDLESGRMRGVEALVRWNHPEKGLIAPMDFLPLAHEIGLINEVCKWVLTHACKQMMTWRDELPAAAELGISVNLDSRQIDASILDRVRTALDVSGLDAAALTLELTEIVIMQNAEVATTVLSELRSLGVGLDIDDFGTGFSSLSHLHRFPIDVLKIDRSFVSRMTDSADELEIVRTIVVLAHNLRLTVVAEGIETEAQLTQLRALGCEAGQGYLFSEPIEAESMARLIEQGIELPEASSSTG